MRAAGDQAKTACENLQLWAGLEASIEGATHVVRQRRLERAGQRRSSEEERRPNKDKGKEETAGEERLTVETEGTEEEAEEILEEALNMEVDADGEGEGEEEGEEEGVGNQGALGSLYFLTQDADPSGTTLVDAHNGFNELSRLAMLWNVRNYWPAGARFAFNCYRHCA